jgi:plasmid replication initiation protein
MLLKQYEKIGVREFDLLDFKKKLRVEKLYPRFNNLRQRIIQQAKKEFDEKDEQGNFLSDINFHFEPIKRGRSVTRIRFTIFKNKHKSLEDPKNVPLIKSDMPILETNTTTELSPTLKQLLDFGVAGATAEKILKKHTNEYIQEKLQLTTEKDRTNPVGFFVKAIKEDYKNANIAKDKIKQEKEEKALKKKQQEQLNDDISSLAKDFGRIERQNFLNSLTEQELAKLTEEIRQACKRDKNGYGQRLFEMGEPLERNFYVESYVNDSIPNFEEAKQRYITDKLAEKGYEL